MPRQSSLRPRKRPRQKRAQETVAAIIEAAAQVFERDGYARATTDRIAERASVSIGSLYQYFPGKDALLVAIAEQHEAKGIGLVRRLLADAGDIARVPLAALLKVFVDALIDLHHDHPRLHRMIFVEAAMPGDRHDAVSSLEDELAAELGAALARHPEVHVADLSLACYVLVHAAQSLVHDYVIHPPPAHVDRATFVAELVRLLGGYLRGPSGRQA